MSYMHGKNGDAESNRRTIAKVVAASARLAYRRPPYLQPTPNGRTIRPCGKQAAFIPRLELRREESQHHMAFFRVA